MTGRLVVHSSPEAQRLVVTMCRAEQQRARGPAELPSRVDELGTVRRAVGSGVASRRLMPARFESMGGAGGVTGSAHLFSTDAGRVLVDCGLFQGEHDGEARNARSPVEAPSELAAVVLTHGHLDHVGRLPVLVEAGFTGPIFGHPATLALAEIVLRDSVRVQQHRGQPGHDAAAVDRVVSQFSPLAYEEKRTLVGDITATLHDAGHILGSASVFFETGGGSILFSGDLGRTGTPLLRDPNTTYPEGVEADWAVIESTYGDREHPPHDDHVTELRTALTKALADNGKVLIPAFSIGRTQEIVCHLHTIYATGAFAGIPVVVDGPMGLDVTELYERFPDCYGEEGRAMLRRGEAPLEFRDLYASRSAKGSVKILEHDGPAIVVAGSGMCTGGRILSYLRELLPDPRTDVLFVGYQARGTLGRRLLDGATEVTIDGDVVHVAAKSTRLAGFSAHADRSGLTSWLSHVPGNPRVLITHGEPEAARALAEHLDARLGAKTHVPALEERIELWG